MNAVPPKISRKGSRVWPANTWFAVIILGVAGLGAGLMVFFFNPTTHAFYPACEFHRLTGLNCPGCGATRALYALLHGNLATALRDNALFVCALAAAAARGVWLAAGKFRHRPVGEFFPMSWAWPLLALALVFAVLRNLPAFSFLSPA
jgi:hypothetical protein